MGPVTRHLERFSRHTDTDHHRGNDIVADESPANSDGDVIAALSPNCFVTACVAYRFCYLST